MNTCDDNTAPALPTLRCDVCDSGIDPEWKRCPWCDEVTAPALPQSEIESARLFGDDVQHWRIRVGALCRERDELRARIEQLEEENNTAPAPDIAGLIGRLEKLGPDGGLWKDAAAALRKLVAENERLKTKVDILINKQDEAGEILSQRIRKLEGNEKPQR